MNSILEIGPVTFPEKSGTYVNMMPFVMGDPESVPEELHGYLPLIDACGLEPEQAGKVGYLSVAESVVISGKSHRRPGIHTDKHPDAGWGGGWGQGSLKEGRRDGIYLASTVPNSCRAWDVHVPIPGKMGDCEHLRDTFEGLQPVVLQPNTLYWMNDSCPHESLPLKEGTFRQWFRLVTHKVDLWYQDHSTPNRLGVLPGCKIITGDKFKE